MISEEQFWDEWEVFKRPTGDLFNFEDVRSQPLNYVWTITESGLDEDGNWYAFPGIHHVNGLGYVMTKKPWEDESEEAIYFLDDLDDGYDTGSDDPAEVLR